MEPEFMYGNTFSLEEFKHNFRRETVDISREELCPMWRYVRTLQTLRSNDKNFDTAMK
jgi:hypothetical protein